MTRGAWRLLGWGSALAGTEALGIFLITLGNQFAAQDYYYNVAPWGAFFIALPLLAGVVCLLAWLFRELARENARYRAWKNSLPRGQRIAIEAAELAALSAAACAWYRHNKAAGERLSASVMGQVPLNRTATAMKAVTGGQVAAKQAAWIQAQQEPGQPAAGSEQGIARLQPRLP